MEVPLNEVVYFDAITSNPSTGAVSDADSTPTFAVYEEGTDTAIVTGNLTKRTSLTGDYRGTYTASAANGFEVGKWYSVVAAATVNSISGKAVVQNFRCVAAETVAGAQVVDVGYVGGSTASTASRPPASLSSAPTSARRSRSTSPAPDQPHTSKPAFGKFSAPSSPKPPARSRGVSRSSSTSRRRPAR
jgi:hypothetical protein